MEFHDFVAGNVRIAREVQGQCVFVLVGLHLGSEFPDQRLISPEKQSTGGWIGAEGFARGGGGLAQGLRGGGCHESRVRMLVGTCRLEGGGGAKGAFTSGNSRSQRLEARGPPGAVFHCSVSGPRGGGQLPSPLAGGVQVDTPVPAVGGGRRGAPASPTSEGCSSGGGTRFIKGARNQRLNSRTAPLC